MNSLCMLLNGSKFGAKKGRFADCDDLEYLMVFWSEREGYFDTEARCIPALCQEG